MGQKAVSAAVETAGDLADVEAVIETIEAYGAEEEDKVAQARRLAAQKAADDEQAEYLKTHCPHCSTTFSPGATSCPQCGAPVG